MNPETTSLIRNIYEHSERMTAIIEATDFNNKMFNPNIILIPSLWNNASDTLIIWALCVKPDSVSENDCRRSAEMILRRMNKLDTDISKHLASMKSLRALYTSDSPPAVFSEKDCTAFLNSYDSFMNHVYSSCAEYKNQADSMFENFSSIFSMSKSFRKKYYGEDETEICTADNAENAVQQNSDTDSDDIKTLLQKILEESKKTNELLTRLLSK